VAPPGYRPAGIPAGIDPTPAAIDRCRRHRSRVNAAHARQRGPGERINAQLKNSPILRKIRSCPNHATQLVPAVQTLMIAST
jgi:hypothetical protein